MLNLGFDSKAIGELVALTLPPRKRQQILRNAGRRFRDQSVKRVKRGRNTDGKKWQEPKSKRIFKRINQKKRTFIATTPNQVTIGYKKSRTGRIARAHQEGVTEKYSVKKAKEHLKNAAVPDYREDATRAQAKELKELGYKCWDKENKKYKSPTLNQIMQTLTLGKAGLIIRLLRAEKRQNADKKTDWTIKRHKRDLLGNTSRQHKVNTAKLRQEALKK